MRGSYCRAPSAATHTAFGDAGDEDVAGRCQHPAEVTARLLSPDGHVFNSVEAAVKNLSGCVDQKLAIRGDVVEEEEGDKTDLLNCVKAGLSSQDLYDSVKTGQEEGAVLLAAVWKRLGVFGNAERITHSDWEALKDLLVIPHVWCRVCACTRRSTKV